MGKLRSKLKRHTKGKTWGKGHSATSNPQQNKHRLKAKSRFFQPNLSLAPTAPTTGTGNALTMEAVYKHDQRQAYNAETTVNDVAGSLKSFKLTDDIEDESMQDGASTSKTAKTFASTYSTCTNMSFKKLLTCFRGNSELHREMLAILTALTEIIRERNGTESSTEYFLLLMEQIEASSEERDIAAGVALLNIGIKSVPTAVLRKRFSESAQTLFVCLQRCVESNNISLIKNVIGCMSGLLRAIDYTTWSYPSTLQYFDAILSFTLHSKPKVRKAAQHAIATIIHGSCFMLPAEINNADETAATTEMEFKTKHHPASARITKFCLNQFKPEVLANSQTTILYMLILIKDTIRALKTDDIRTLCEHLLSIMTAPNVMIRNNSMQALHALFISRTSNLNSNLCAKLLAAIHEYRPDRADVRQTLAWLTVLKEGHIHLALLDLHLCVSALPRFFDVCTTDLWMSDRAEIIIGVSNCVKELLYECVKTACVTQELADSYRLPIAHIISLIDKVLSAPFGDVAKYVVLTFSIVFEVCGEYFSTELKPSLLTLSKRYDTHSALRIQIEHSIIAAIKYMGPESVLAAIPLTNAEGVIAMEKTWLLPLLREGTTGATFKFFKNTILPLAVDCNAKWDKFAKEKHTSMSHTYELLCCQLWGLFPGFCRQPRDPENFSLLAPTLGYALDNNPEFRAPIFDGFIELIEGNENNKAIDEMLAKYAKNFLPRLFNTYTKKPSGTYEADLRKKSLEVVQAYLVKTPEDVRQELFENAQNQLANTAVGNFEYDAIFDITATLVLHQTCQVIRLFFDRFIVTLLKNDKSKLVSQDIQKLRKQQRKAYGILRDILVSEAASCQKFCRKNVNVIQNLLLETFATSCKVCRAARLKCLKITMDNRKGLTVNDEIVMKIIPEAVLSYKEYSTRQEDISEEIILMIANLYQDANKLNDFVDILTAGFAGDDSLIANTVLAFCAILRNQGKNLTITTLEFLMEQVSVFLVQKSRLQAEASVTFMITFIKVMPEALIANYVERIMRSLSAMTPDTKRHCRLQIGYLLRKLCKRFTAEELAKLVPGDDEVTHRRLKKIRKQLRRETRQKVNAQKGGSAEEDDSDEEFITGVEKKSVTIDDILADSDSDLPIEEEEDDNIAGKRTQTKAKKERNTFIREDPEDIVDLADIKSIGNVLTNHPDLPSTSGAANKAKVKDANRGFKTADDGRLIISDKAMRGIADADDDDDDGDSSDASGGATDDKKAVKRGMENDSSDEEPLPSYSRKRKAADNMSMRSGKTSTSRYTTGGKGIHRNLMNSDAVSMKSGYSAKTASAHNATDYATKKAKGDMKKKGKLDPYAYIPLSRNTLNKRKRAKHAGQFKGIVKGARKGALKGVKSRISKAYKKS